MVRAALFSCVVFCLLNSSYGASRTDQVTYGSAFSLSGQGLLVTAHHVVKGMSRIVVQSANDGVGIEAKLLAHSESDDLALLRVSNVVTKPLPLLGASDELRDGMAVFALGFPGGQVDGEVLVATPGVVSGALAIDNRLIFRHTADVGPGRSGGPVLDEEGRVVGMVLARMASSRVTGDRKLVHNSVALSVEPIKKLLDSSGIPIGDRMLVDGERSSMDKRVRPEVGMRSDLFSGSIFRVVSSQPKKMGNPKAKSRDELPAEVQEMLSSLSSEMGRKFFGAYKAGYSEFLKTADGIFMVKSKEVRREMFPKVKGQVIVSTNEPKFTPNDVVYFSSINDIEIDCSSTQMALIRKEFKRDSFGIGETVKTFRLRGGVAPTYRPIASRIVREFLQNTLCKPPEAMR